LIQPNYGDHHIFTIVCGAGNHSIDDSRLKNHLKTYLKNKNFDFDSEMRDGVHLVCLRP